MKNLPCGRQKHLIWDQFIRSNENSNIDAKCKNVIKYIVISLYAVKFTVVNAL